MGSQTNDGGTKAGAPELLGIRILGGRTLFRPVMDLARQLSCPHTNHNGTKAGAPELLGVRILGGRTLFCPVMDLARQRHINCQNRSCSWSSWSPHFQCLRSCSSTTFKSTWSNTTVGAFCHSHWLVFIFTPQGRSSWDKLLSFIWVWGFRI